jgi:hypothetical protein
MSPPVVLVFLQRNKWAIESFQSTARCVEFPLLPGTADGFERLLQ